MFSFVLAVCFAAPTPPSLLCLGLVFGLLSVSTDSISVTVPCGCHSQGCHGYLHAMLESCLPPPYQDTLPKQAHLLMMSLGVKSHILFNLFGATCTWYSHTATRFNMTLS